MATDVAALQAQSEAGQAGLAAYQQAQTELERRRKQAIEQAMQEAALRGATGTAVTAAGEGIGAPADERLMSLGSDRALYEADMARRAERMNQYSSGVQSARGLLGQQVDLATAPIRAQSAADVAKIEAQARAELARLNAAAAARGGGGGGRGGGGRGGGGGGGGSKKVNQTEASKLLANRAQTNIQSRLNPVKAAQAQNVKAQPAIQQAEFARQASSYAGRAAQEWAQQHPVAKPAPIAQQVGMATQGANYAAKAAAEWAKTHGGERGNADQVIRQAQQQAMSAQRAGPAQTRYRADLRSAPMYDPGKRINELLGGGFRGMTNTSMDDAGNIIPSKVMRPRPVGDVMKAARDVLGEEVDLGPDVGKVLTRDLGKVNLGGDVFDLSRYDTNQAEIDRLQSDPDTWRNALLDAYQQLVDEGYQIDDAMFLAATEPSTASVGTYGDWINQRQNAPSDSEIRAQQNALETDERQWLSDEERAIAEDEAAALEESRGAFSTKTGGWDLKGLAGGGLSEQTVIDITNQPTFGQLLNDAQAAFDESDDEFESFLRESNVPSMQRILLRKMVG